MSAVLYKAHRCRRLRLQVHGEGSLSLWLQTQTPRSSCPRRFSAYRQRLFIPVPQPPVAAHRHNQCFKARYAGSACTGVTLRTLTSWEGDVNTKSAKVVATCSTIQSYIMVALPTRWARCSSRTPHSYGHKQQLLNTTGRFSVDGEPCLRPTSSD
jgi:hypothetical protein